MHGGTSLQEVVVPVIRLKRERKNESRVVEAELLRVPAKITMVKLSFGLFQLEAVEPRKRLPLQLRTVLLDSAAGDYNNQTLELRLEQLLDGVSQPQAYKTVDLKLQRPFGSDFDDF